MVRIHDFQSWGRGSIPRGDYFKVSYSDILFILLKRIYAFLREQSYMELPYLEVYLKAQDPNQGPFKGRKHIEQTLLLQLRLPVVKSCTTPPMEQE